MSKSESLARTVYLQRIVFAVLFLAALYPVLRSSNFNRSVRNIFIATQDEHISIKPGIGASLYQVGASSEGVCKDWPSYDFLSNIGDEEVYDRKENYELGISCTVRNSVIIKVIFWYNTSKDHATCEYLALENAPYEPSVFEVIDVLGNPDSIRSYPASDLKHKDIELKYLSKGIDFCFEYDRLASVIVYNKLSPTAIRQEERVYGLYKGDIGKLWKYAKEAQSRLDNKTNKIDE